MDNCDSMGATGSGRSCIHGDMLCVPNSFKARYMYIRMVLSHINVQA